jgi:hypothetical protein
MYEKTCKKEFFFLITSSPLCLHMWVCVVGETADWDNISTMLYEYYCIITIARQADRPWKDKTHRRQCKMSSSKNLPVKGLCVRCLSIWGHITYTLYTVRVFSILIHTRKWERGGGRVEPDRRLEGQQFTKLGLKYQHEWLYLQSINS